MPVPERGGAELAVGASRVGDRRGHRWEPVGHEVVIRRDHFGLGQRGAGDEEGSGKKQTGELWHTGAPFAMSVEKATALSARWRDVGAQYGSAPTDFNGARSPTRTQRRSFRRIHEHWGRSDGLPLSREPCLLPQARSPLPAHCARRGLLAV